MHPTVNVLFDKSAFQRLTDRDALDVHAYLGQVLPPILAREVIGDLAREMPAGRSADDLVTALARKFIGSGPPITWDCGTMCMMHLLGDDIPCLFGVPVLNAHHVPTEDGNFGIYVEPSQTNLDLLRWARGDFGENERDAATAWRGSSRGFRLSTLEAWLEAHHVVFERATTLEGCLQSADRVLDTRDLRSSLARYLADEITDDPSLRSGVSRRMLTAPPHLPLRVVALYAWYCLRVMLFYYIARKYTLIPTDRNDEGDLQYLNYLPYCDVFVSADTLHKRLAPHLIMREQRMVTVEALQADFAARRVEWEALDEAARDRRARSFGGYPIPMEGSILTALYDQYLGPWPGSGNSVVALSDDQLALAMNEARTLWDAHLQRKAAQA